MSTILQNLQGQLTGTRILIDSLKLVPGVH